MKPSAGLARRKLWRGGGGSRRRPCLAGGYHTGTGVQPRDDLGAPYTSAPTSPVLTFTQALHPGVVAVGSLPEPHITQFNPELQTELARGKSTAHSPNPPSSSQAMGRTCLYAYYLSPLECQLRREGGRICLF